MRRPRAGRLIKNATALTISGAGSAVLGVAFWSLAAHRASTASVGHASAEIAILILLASLAQLGFGSTFERFLPVAGNLTGPLVTRAYAASVSVGIVLAIGYIASGIGSRVIPSSLGWRALFVVATAVWTVFTLQDYVLVGLRASRWVPVENILYSAAKLALIPAALIISKTWGLFLAWTAPVILLVVAVNWYLYRKRIPDHVAQNSSSEKLPSTRELVFLTSSQYANLLVNVISPSIVALIVIQRLGAVASAHYYLPAQIVGGASLVMNSITRSFLVEASSEAHNLRRHARVAWRTGLIVLVLCVAVGTVAAPYILKIFGPTYAATGVTLLRMLLLALPGYAIASFYSAFALIDKRVWWMTLRDLIGTGVFFGVVLVLIGHFGIVSIGIASLVEAGLLGIFFLPILMRRYRAIPADAQTYESSDG